MPRKTIRERRENSPSDLKKNRIRGVLNNLKGVEDPEKLFLEILEVLQEITNTPESGKYYTFVYAPKTSGIRYDAHPLVAVTDVFEWGFKGINFHWGSYRQYTWEEIRGDIHIVYDEEIKDLRAIPYGVRRQS
jgi:hypothetical protein